VRREHHRPVIAFAKKGDLWGGLLVRSVLSGDVRRWIACLRDRDPLEHRARRLELQVCLVLAAACAESFGDSHACERRFIGRADFVPQSRSFGKEPFRFRRIALREPHPSLSNGRAGDERLALESGGHELEFLGGRARPVEVPGRELDLDLRLE
jgi:hypothetical protein